jgi:hypothetical protein
MHRWGARGAIVELDARVRGSRKPPRARWILAATISAVIIALAALGGVLGGQAERTPKDTDTAPAFAEQEQGTGKVPSAEARVRVELVASEKVQVNVQADGVEIFDGTLDPDTPMPFRARGALEVIAADGGALRVTLNGRDLGLLGERGAIARVRLGPNGRINA